ncbi:F-box protein FBW2-like [Humulus lupulus]|uniref:F-box protein FBW2-like n=1 Tax=Humulus lupulus TaxID=3486 RepID=UPI002B411E1A|nr:F-box protein FBW2-like [Humulus lupulus]
MDDLLDLDDSYYVYTVIEDLDEFRTADVIKSMHFPLLLEMLVRKNSGQVHSLSCGGLLNAQILSLVADHAQSLRTLKMPGTNLSKDSTIFETVLAVRLSSFLVHLDISKCYGIGASAIRAIGYNCKNLARLDMNFIMTNNGTSDEEAFAVASTMPKLKHLEISYLTISNEGVLNILSSCTQLQYLDISGCSHLQGCERLFENFSGLKVFLPQQESEKTLFLMDNLYLTCFFEYPI